MREKQAVRSIRALYFLYYAAFAIFTVFINVYYREIGLSGVQIGWINALAPLVGIFGGPLWGYLSDHTGRPRLIMALAVLGSALAGLGISAARVFAWLLPLAAAWNLFNSTLAPLIDSANLTTLPGRSEQYGQQRMWGTLGYVVLSFSAGLVLERTGLQSMFLVYVALMLVMLAAVPLLPGQRGQAQATARLEVRALITRREWLFFTASLIPLWVASNGMYSFLGVYLRDLGADAVLIGSTSAVGSITELPMMLFSAFFVRKLGLKRMLVISYALYGVRMLLYGLIPSPGWAVLVTAMHGLTYGLFWVAGVVYTNELVPDNLRTTGQALFFAVMSLAGVIGSPFSGWMYDTLGGGQLFRIYGLLCFLSLAILLVGFASARRREAPSQSA